jgi:cell division septal protein FtsQ
MRLNTVEVVLDPESHESFMFEKIQSGLQASLTPFTGLPFWKISLEKVMAEVKKDHRVRLARVQREFPHILRVIVVPQEPMLAYMDERGRIYPVARDATLMPALPLKDVPNFPLLRGKEFVTDASLREKAVELMAAIPTEGRFQRRLISEILHNNKDGFSLFLADHAAEIKMGESDFELKASRVEKVLSYLHNRNLSGRTIDARFSKKVVVRVRGHQRSE